MRAYEAAAQENTTPATTEKRIHVMDTEVYNYQEFVAFTSSRGMDADRMWNESLNLVAANTQEVWWRVEVDAKNVMWKWLSSRERTTK